MQMNKLRHLFFLQFSNFIIINFETFCNLAIKFGRKIKILGEIFPPFMSKKIFISAGDTSGDIHAAKLINKMKELDPEISFFGIGGTEMEKTGFFKSIIPLKEISVVGFYEVAKKIQLFRKLMKDSLDLIKNENIDVVIPVDYPGFNIELAKRLKKSSNKKVIYYIAPQLWAWGKDRATKLQNCIDLLLVVFPFEKDFFQKFGIPTEFVGHPLLDDQIFHDDFKTYDERNYSCIFMPGSRKQEIIKHLPLLNNTALELKKFDKELKCKLIISNNLDKEIIYNKIDDRINWEFKHNSKKQMQKSLVGVIKTGTSNLEASLLGIPYNMFYITSFITYNMGKRLINLDYLSLPNIIMKRNVIDEFIQSDATPQKISNSIINLIKNRNDYDKMQNDFRDLKHYIGGEGASLNVAKIILNYLK